MSWKKHIWLKFEIPGGSVFGIGHSIDWTLLRHFFGHVFITAGSFSGAVLAGAEPYSAVPMAIFFSMGYNIATEVAQGAHHGLGEQHFFGVLDLVAGVAGTLLAVYILLALVLLQALWGL